MNVTPNISTGLILTFSDVFGEEKPQSLDFYLSQIPKNDIIRSMSQLLGYFNRNSQYGDYKGFLAGFFQTANSKLHKHTLDVIDKLIKEDPSRKITIHHATSSLYLLEYAFKYGNDIPTPENFDTVSFEVNLLKAYLLANEEYINKQNIGLIKLRDDSKLRGAKLLLIMSLADVDLINYDLMATFYAQIIKSNILFNFLKSKEECKILLSKFLEYYNSSTIEEFFIRLLPLIMTCVTRPKEGATYINVERDESYQESCAFLDLFSASVVSENSVDFLSIRNNPLYKLNEGSYIIMHPLFMAEKIYKSLYFSLNTVNSSLPNDQKASRDFRSYYGSEFTENYLLTNILNHLFINPLLLLSGQEIREKYDNFDAEPDYYCRDNDNNIYIFELKETFINATVKTSLDIDLITQELVEKLHFKSNGGNTKPKAIKQIVNNIKRLLDKQLVFDTFQSNKNIYSILILSDEAFNAPGINTILNDWFTLELEVLKNSGYDISNIKPIIAMTIDSVILLNDHIRDNFIFKDTLDIYIHSYLKEGSIHNHEPFSIFIQNFLSERKYLNYTNLEVTLRKLIGAF